jgi:hypothetical protein
MKPAKQLTPTKETRQLTLTRETLKTIVGGTRVGHFFHVEPAHFISPPTDVGCMESEACTIVQIEQ